MANSKEGTKSGKGLSWSWFGLNDGKRDAKILRELGEVYKKGAVDVDVFNQKIKGLTVSSRANAKEMKANSANNIEFSKGLLNAAASADKMTISTKLAALGVKALSIACNMLIAFGISSVLNFVIEGITHLANAQKEAIEKADELTTAWKEQESTLKSHKDTIKEISAEYELLSYGVDSMGKNISLTTDEYSKYNEIVNQIADMFPDMVKGHTDEGDAILKKKGQCLSTK